MENRTTPHTKSVLRIDSSSATKPTHTHTASVQQLLRGSADWSRRLPRLPPPRSQHYVLKPETFGPGDGKAGRWISHISPAVRADRVPDVAGLVRPAPLVSAQGSRRSGRGRLQNGGARNRRGVRVRERGGGAGSFI